MVLPPASDDWYLDNDAAASYPRAISPYTKVALVDYDGVFDDRIANLYGAPNESGGTKLVVAQPYGNTRLAWAFPRSEDDAYDITETFDSTATGATVSFDLKLDWTAYQPASDFSGTLDIYALAGDHETLDPAQLDGDDDDGTSLDPALSFSAGSGDPSSTGEIVSIAGVQDLGDGWIRVTLPEVDFTGVDDEDKQVMVLFDVSNRVADHVTSFELDNLEATPTLP
jgi:hypothetical protein